MVGFIRDIVRVGYQNIILCDGVYPEQVEGFEMTTLHRFHLDRKRGIFLRLGLGEVELHHYPSVDYFWELGLFMKVVLQRTLADP